MDELDKTLLLKLLRNCRASYRQLARELGVTCPTIKRRVDSLVEVGVIEAFTVDISQETLGVSWAYAEITTDLSEDRARLLNEISDNKSTNETFAVGSKKYISFAEVSPDAVYDYGKYLRGLSGVSQVDLVQAQQIPTQQLSNHCKYSTRGKRVDLSTQQKTLLHHLMDDARMSIQDLSAKTGYKPKRIRRILRELEESEGIHFTIRFNPAAESIISFILKIGFDESQITPGEIATWLENEFPQEYWMSFLLLNGPVMINYMTSDNLPKIEVLLRKMLEIPFVHDVETILIYHIQKPTSNGSDQIEQAVAASAAAVPVTA
ncbi:MAG: AsnC family transcriptional regulator [Candidatus Thorarchaeota archaeon]|jgi:DNA-binding Lrp family transcriptional regulator